MKDRVAILTRRKTGCVSLLDDLNKAGVRRSEVFYAWEDMLLSEQKNEYDFILIDYCFFDKLRDDIAYYLFHKYKLKITFYSTISQKVKTEKGNVVIDLDRFFFRPFMDFNSLINSTKNDESPTGFRDAILGMDFEKKNKGAFFLKEGYSLIKFHLNDALCLVSDRNYITVYLSDGKHLMRETLQSILGILPNNFLKVNRSVIVNVDKIYKVKDNRIHINGLDSFQPVIANKYKLDILNAVPLFSKKKVIEI